MHSEKIKKKILNNLDNFKNFPHNEKLRDEFISCMDYLIDHTKELVHKKNFLEAANNQKLLNHIFKFLICNNINCYLAEYETYYLDLFELRSLYKESERDKLAESIDELLTMDECMNSKHKNKKSPIINIIFSISKN